MSLERYEDAKDNDPRLRENLGSVVGGLTMESIGSLEDRERFRKQQAISKQRHAAGNSVNRICQALDVTRTEESGALLRSDLDNAIRHSVQLTKQLREIKKSLFPTETKTPTTNGQGSTPATS